VRYRALGLSLLIVLIAHLCASPFSILYVGLPASGAKTPTCQTASALRETPPLALEEKVRVKTFSVTARTEVIVQDVSAARPLRWVHRLPKTCLGLSGFQLTVSERPPPSRV